MPSANSPFDATLADIAALPFRDVAPPRWYISQDTNCPHLLVMRLPAILVRRYPGDAGPLNGRFKVVVVESKAEVEEAERLISRPLDVTPFSVSYLSNIDVIAGRPSAMPLPRSLPMAMAYHSNDRAWPSIVVTSMPPAFAMPGLQRGIWAYDIFSTPKQAFRHLNRIADLLEGFEFSGASRGLIRTLAA